MTVAPVRVLLLGQTPPPYGGQAVMIENLLKGDMPGVDRRHVRLAYSTELTEAGRFRAGKVLHLASVIARGFKETVGRRPDVLYYPPAGPDRTPAIRDVVTLLALRPLCDRLVLHFHAGGISRLLERGGLPRTLRPLFQKAFFGADAAVVTAAQAPPDPSALKAQRTYVVPYGIDDAAEGRVVNHGARSALPRVLFVGVVIEEKGVVDLVTAARRLWDSGCAFALDLVGACEPSMAARLREIAGSHATRIELHGVLAGEAKWARYAASDVMAFPTFFRSETFGLVCVEAMMFGLPVVATSWSGVRDVVDDGVTGHLVPVHGVDALASRIQALVDSPSRRAELGAAGRRKFLERYRVERYRKDLRSIFLRVAGRKCSDGGVAAS